MTVDFSAIYTCKVSNQLFKRAHVHGKKLRTVLEWSDWIKEEITAQSHGSSFLNPPKSNQKWKLKQLKVCCRNLKKLRCSTSFLKIRSVWAVKRNLLRSACMFPSHCAVSLPWHTHSLKRATRLLVRVSLQYLPLTCLTWFLANLRIHVNAVRVTVRLLPC